MLRLAVLVAAMIGALALCSAATADDGDAARISVQSARVGDRFNLHLEVAAPKGAQVEVLSGGDSWAGVEVLDTVATSEGDRGGTPIHSIDLVVAAFTTGNVSFSPEVSLTQAGETAVRTLPAVRLHVVAVLSPGDKLELSPLVAPESIEGEQSPFLLPAEVLAGVVAALLLGMGVVFATFRFRSQNPRASAVSLGAPAAAGLMRAEELLLNDDPVAGYRSMATTVRSVLGERYGIPAPALTTRELRRRMEGAGVDRWQSRLVGGLLEECDAVVYAGYRPAQERLTADLNMAREIVELPAPGPGSA
jgi:hypothetical protein